MQTSAGVVRSAPGVAVEDRRVFAGRAQWRALAAVALIALALGAALVVAAGLLLDLGSSGRRSPVARGVGAHSGSRGFEREGLLSLPLAAQGSASRVLGANSPAFRLRGAEGGFAAVNPAQHLRARFTSSGVAVAVGTADLELSLRSVGFGAALAPVSTVAPVAHGNRVSYARAGLNEWYANGPLGIEQGFTVARAPTGNPSRPLTFSFALAGNVRASLLKGGQAISLTRGGRSVLRYRGLSVTDARGRTLHGWLGLSGGRLLLRVDAAGAAYPVSYRPVRAAGQQPHRGRRERRRLVRG